MERYGKEVGDTNTIRTVEELLLEFRAKKSAVSPKKLSFLGTNGRDVYNITSPFLDEGDMVIAGRVEERNSEDSEVVFFRQNGEVWEAAADRQRYRLQDPFFSQIKGELVIGGVELIWDTAGEKIISYRTVFYKGETIKSLKRFAAGPDGMKDIRLCELDDGKILVMTRPQGRIGGRGKIGYTILEDLMELDADAIEKAKILEQFVESEWGGSNQLHRLSNGRVGVLGHIARFDSEGNRHYYPTAFCFNPNNGEYSQMKIIAERADFESGPAKRADLADVIFSGGIVRQEKKRAIFYCGTSDAEGHSIELPDPFCEYE